MFMWKTHLKFKRKLSILGPKTKNCIEVFQKNTVNF